MPVVGLKRMDGTEVRFEDIKALDAPRYGVSPATIIYLKSQGDRRKEVKGISASQWGKGLRQLWLERTKEVYEYADASIAALMGTAKHAHVLTDGYNDPESGVITEYRVFDKTGRISAQIDQIVIRDGAKNVELWDAKTGKLYSLKKFKERPDGHPYTMQLNLARDLYEINFPNHSVRSLWIEWFPSDAGRDDVKAEMVPVPMMEKGVALSMYQEILAELDALIDLNDIPSICTPEERWDKTDRKTGAIEPIKCIGYCPYVSECKAVSRSLGEKHPMEDY